jgi:hypothetical protein
MPRNPEFAAEKIADNGNIKEHGVKQDTQSLLELCIDGEMIVDISQID